MTTHDLAMIRQTILRVIDDGDPQQPLDRCWKFYERLKYQTEGGTVITVDEQFTNAQRLDFCSRIQEFVTQELAIPEENEVTQLGRVA